MTVLIDSWTWIEYWKGGPQAKEAAKHIEGNEEAIVSTINLAEIHFWITKYYNENIANEKTATVEKRCYTIPVEREIAIEAAKIKKTLRLSLADSLILATAKQTNAKIVTGDPDFKNIENVTFLGYPQQTAPNPPHSQTMKT